MISKPKILTDFTRLQEIYNLRCLAWENGPYPDGVNFKNYPNGFSEELDIKSIHFVIFNEQTEIIASSRLTIINDFEELPYPKFFHHFLTPSNDHFYFIHAW